MTTTDASRSVSILIVGDDQDMRLYLRRCLQTLGSAECPPSISEAVNGRDALLLARALSPDLIISDLVLTGLDGTTFHDALRTDTTLTDIPILFISGESRLPPNADAFLAKPFNATQLRSAVERLLGAPT